MTSRSGPIHVAKIERKYKGKVYVSYLLRRTYREGGKVKHETVGNISHLPAQLIDTVRRSLQGETFVAAKDAFKVQRSLPHGHVEAVLAMIRKLELDRLICSTRSRQRDLVLAMIVQRLLFPCSKLATTRHWHSTTLAEELTVADADEDELYEAMDWLLRRQPRIEAKLAERHLTEGGLVLYDVTSSYYEGRTCPLAKFGHDRDGKKGRPIIVYGMLTDGDGRAVATEVYAGNTGDPTTIPDQVDKIRGRFGLSRVVLVGDRGMLTQTKIDTLKEHPGLGWISALRSQSIRKLVESDDLSRSLFDDVNLAEITTPEFPEERLIACYNPLLADERTRKREDLLAATEKQLEKIAKEAARRRKKKLTDGEINRKVGRVVNRFKMAKHFKVTVKDGAVAWARDQASIEAEKQLDGVYVIRTSEPAERLSSADAVRSYKRLSDVERAFRCIKGVEMLVRPIHHRDESRVRAHIFICMLAYYVQWHLKHQWAPLLFEDEELQLHRRERDPVASAEPSTSVKRKKATRQTEDGLPVHSFRTLLAELATRCRNTCQVASETGRTFSIVTEQTPLQAKAFELLGQ